MQRYSGSTDDDAPDPERQVALEAAYAHHMEGAPLRSPTPPVYPKPISELRRELEANYIPGRSKKRPKHDQLAVVLESHGLRNGNQGKTATEISHLIAGQLNVQTAENLDTLRRAIERYYKRVAQEASAR